MDSAMTVMQPGRLAVGTEHIHTAVHIGCHMLITLAFLPASKITAGYVYVRIT